MSQIYIRGLVQVGVECLQDYPDHKNKKVRHKSLSRLNNSNFLLLGVFIIKPSAVSSGDLFQWYNLLHFDTGRGGQTGFPARLSQCTVGGVCVSLPCICLLWFGFQAHCPRAIFASWQEMSEYNWHLSFSAQPGQSKEWMKASDNEFNHFIKHVSSFFLSPFDSLFLSLFERMLGQLFILFSLLIFHFPASFIFFFSFHIFPSRLWPLPSMTYLWPFWDYLLYLGFEAWVACVLTVFIGLFFK